MSPAVASDETVVLTNGYTQEPKVNALYDGAEVEVVADIDNQNRPYGYLEFGASEFAARCKSRDRRSFAYKFIKRLFDIVFSSCVIAVGFIPGLLLSVAIAIDTKGTPIYFQERVGKWGKTFRIYKFRTMVADSDDVEKYFTSEQLEVWKRERKVEDDPRVTNLGRILRSTSIDEIPQFLNVLLGSMSVIGCRPITKDEIEQHFSFADASELLSMRPGVSGLWQATSRNEATFESGERQSIELDYVRHSGLIMDAKCFIGTFSAAFGKNRTGR